jgi:hypothetical protein
MIAPADFILMPLSGLLTPSEGSICMLDRWWVVRGLDALFYKGYTSPQCNSLLVLASKIAVNVPFPTELLYIRVAYIPHQCSWYV